jgi:hypothetical protein
LPLRLIDRHPGWAYLGGMCVGSAIRADIRVSIQDRNAPDRVSGHVATGILVDGDIVLVPNIVFEDDSGGRELEALIFPTELDEHSRIDKEDIWKLTLFSLHGREPFATSGRLLHHSSYAAQIGEVDSGVLASTLELTDGDLWEAIIRLGAVRPEIREIDPGLLERVTEIERAQRQPKRNSHAFDSYQQATDGWCIFFCFCQTDGKK